MAGPGIRYWELARVLAAEHRVTLIAPQPITLHAPALPTLACGSYAWGDRASLLPWLRKADVVLANGILLHSHPEVAQGDYPLAIDMYDPVALENLELFRMAPMPQRMEVHAQDTALLKRQLAAGDFFLCATERQRDLYMGGLLTAGRITPALVDEDPLLRGLIDVVPYGLPSMRPVKQQPALRGVVPGIGADDPLLLWSGGLWDWMDPLTLIRAMPQIVVQVPPARLVFLAGQHPSTAPPVVQPMRMPQAARSLADELGLLGTHIFFYEQWIPYEQRADFLLEADVLVYLHHPGLESAYAAVRSRFLDHLWAGRASLLSAGDAAAALVQTHQLGYTAPAGDVEAVAAQASALLRDPARREACVQRTRSLAASYTWEQVAAPLRAFCQRPRRTRKTGSSKPQAASIDDTSIHSTAGGVQKAEGFQPDPGAGDTAQAADTSEQTGTEAMNDQERNALLDRLNHLWKVQPQPLASGLPLLGQAKELANSLTRWYVQSVVDQQNAFNAALVQAVQALSANSDSRHDQLTQHIHFLHHQVHSVRLEIAPLIRRFERDERLIQQNSERIASLFDDLKAVVAHLEQRIAHNQADILNNHRVLVEVQEVVGQIQQDLRDNQEIILTTQQTTARTQDDQRQSQRILRECQELIDQLRERIEVDERRSERNKVLLEQLVQHLNDVDEADTVLTTMLLQLQQHVRQRNGQSGAPSA